MALTPAVKKLSGSEYQEQYPKTLSQMVGRNGGGAPRGKWRDQTSGKRAPQKRIFDYEMVLAVRVQRRRGTAEEVKKIYSGCLQLTDALGHREPEYQKRAAAYAEAGEYSGQRARQCPRHHSITERRPPQISSRPKIRRSRSDETRLKAIPDIIPPIKPPTRYGAANRRSTAPRET